MTRHISPELYSKIITLSKNVRDNLRRRGIAVPVENKDGSVTLGNYTIVKNGDNFYSILDYSMSPVVTMINLPQTALMLTNGLALGKFLDTELLDKDRRYGYALFEEQLESKLYKLKSDVELKLLRKTKELIATRKKEVFLKDIQRSFEKLRNLA